MRTLIVIPHAYLGDSPGDRRYGSERTGAADRAALLLRCVSALQQTFGPRQHLVGPPEDPRCNRTIDSEIEIVLCTAGNQHLCHTVPSHMVHHHSTTLHPRLLGFACHAILRDNAGRFDWFGYLEDDCEITDPLFFSKLAWFNSRFKPDAMLQPNRFEVSTGPVVQKLYIDGRLTEQDAAWPRLAARDHLIAKGLGQSWRFRRVSNPHSGCFFADAAQMARLAADPAFGQYSDGFLGPLETAASLPIMRNFSVYKPAPENAAFLEIRHLDQQVLERRLTFAMNDRGEIVRTVV